MQYTDGNRNKGDALRIATKRSQKSAYQWLYFLLFCLHLHYECCILLEATAANEDIDIYVRVVAVATPTNGTIHKSGPKIQKKKNELKKRRSKNDWCSVHYNVWLTSDTVEERSNGNRNNRQSRAHHIIQNDTIINVNSNISFSLLLLVVVGTVVVDVVLCARGKGRAKWRACDAAAAAATNFLVITFYCISL